MNIQVDESLRDRADYPVPGRCPVEAAMNVVGSRCSMLIMREAFYGTHRFDEFVTRVAVSPATASTHLTALVDAGLLERRPYQIPGSRTRDDYHLTDAGHDFLPVVLALFQWGRAHAPARNRFELAHTVCGAPMTVNVTCANGHDTSLDEIELRPHPISRTAGGAADSCILP